MKFRAISIVLVLALVLTPLACETIPEEHKGAAVGAGVGAVAGGAAGAAIGKDAKGVVIGALVGALVGGVIGHYAYDKRRTRNETVRTYGYKSAQGSILTLEDGFLSSKTIKPGDVLKIGMTYAVLNPSPEAKVSITETREITYGNELVGKPEIRVDRADGTYTSTVPIRMPSTAKKGAYRVRITIQSENAKDTKELSFRVV